MLTDKDGTGMSDNTEGLATRSAGQVRHIRATMRLTSVSESTRVPPMTDLEMAGDGSGRPLAALK